VKPNNLFEKPTKVSDATKTGSNLFNKPKVDVKPSEEPAADLLNKLKVDVTKPKVSDSAEKPGLLFGAPKKLEEGDKPKVDDSNKGDGKSGTTEKKPTSAFGAQTDQTKKPLFSGSTPGFGAGSGD
jgi:hypothetical protein